MNENGPDQHKQTQVPENRVADMILRAFQPPIDTDTRKIQIRKITLNYIYNTFIDWINEEELNCIIKNIWEKALWKILKFHMLTNIKKDSNTNSTQIPKPLRKYTRNFNKPSNNNRSNKNNAQIIDFTKDENPNKTFEFLYNNWESWKYEIFKGIDYLIKVTLNETNQERLNEIIEYFMYKRNINIELNFVKTLQNCPF